MRVIDVRRAVIALALAVAACDTRSPPAASRDDSPAITASDSSRPIGKNLWNDSLGTLIATVSAQNGRPILYMSDSIRVGTVEVELFSHDTQVVRGVLRVERHANGCPWQRAAQFVRQPNDAGPAPWSLALSPGIGRPMAIDAIGELAPRDSSSLAIQVSRLASALPDDSISAPFRGLPVVVRDAWRFQLADGAPVAVAVVMRSTNVESNPRAEMVLMVAEPDLSSATRGWQAFWMRRNAGPEERIEGADLLAALQLRNGHAAVVFMREGDRGMQVEFVERVARGAWRTKWSSVALSCTSQTP